MKKILLALTLIPSLFFHGSSFAQENDSLADDIDPVSLSRMPIVDRNDLDEEGKEIFDELIGRDRATPRIGPAGVSMHMPLVARAMNILNDYLRYESVIGRRYIEVAIIVAAREFDQEYEWSSHAPTALIEGTPQAVVDAIAYNRGVDGLPAKESLIIRYGREILREHKLSSETWAEAVDLFGQQGALEISAIIGDYLLAAVILHAVDQQIPPERTARMPMD